MATPASSQPAVKTGGPAPAAGSARWGNREHVTARTRIHRQAGRPTPRMSHRPLVRTSHSRPSRRAARMADEAGTSSPRRRPVLRRAQAPMPIHGGLQHRTEVQSGASRDTREGATGSCLDTPRAMSPSPVSGTAHLRMRHRCSGSARAGWQGDTSYTYFRVHQNPRCLLQSGTGPHLAPEMPGYAA